MASTQTAFLLPSHWRLFRPAWRVSCEYNAAIADIDARDPFIGTVVLDIDAFCEVFNRLDREIWLITARAGDRCSGLIATYVSRASLVPTLPRVTIGLAKHHFTHQLMKTSNAFCMHLLDEDHIDWVWHFGIPSGQEIDKLRGLESHTSVTGSPIVGGAPAWLDCRVEAVMDTGDRTFYLAEVLDAHLVQTATPLTFKRLLQLAPADKVRQMNLALERDIIWTVMRFLSGGTNRRWAASRRTSYR